MIIESFYDMRIFIVVLLIGVFAFADAFQSIDQILVINGHEVREAADDAYETDSAVLNGYRKYVKDYVIAW